MHNKDNDGAAKSQDLITSGGERIESIEELLRERGFFDSVKPENNE
jgi:hypothetical protein